jgi:hypothetical protein
MPAECGGSVVGNPRSPERHCKGTTFKKVTPRYASPGLVTPRRALKKSFQGSPKTVKMASTWRGVYSLLRAR